MAKTGKQTREQQYAEILSERGFELSKCTVLGFKFPDEAHAHGFHFDLMGATSEIKVEWLLFDSMADGTAIVILRSDKYAGFVRATAEQDDGTEYKPNLKQ